LPAQHPLVFAAFCLQSAVHALPGVHLQPPSQTQFEQQFAWSVAFAQLAEHAAPGVQVQVPAAHEQFSQQAVLAVATFLQFSEHAAPGSHSQAPAAQVQLAQHASPAPLPVVDVAGAKETQAAPAAANMLNTTVLIIIRILPVQSYIFHRARRVLGAPLARMSTSTKNHECDVGPNRG